MFDRRRPARYTVGMADRKLVLSPTRIRTYLECPRLYRYVYLEKLPRYFKARASFSFGTSLHRALQEYHAAGGPQTQDAAALAGRLEQHWIGAGYNSTASEQQRAALGREILAAYHDAGAGQEGVTRFTEKTLRADMGDYFLTGRVDRIDELADGSLEVIDYKSGAHLPSPAEVADDLAIAIYQLLCVRLLARVAVKGSILHLLSGQKVSVTRSPAALEPVAAAVDDLHARIRSEQEFARVADERCEGCDFFHRCFGRRPRGAPPAVEDVAP